MNRCHRPVLGRLALLLLAFALAAAPAAAEVVWEQLPTGQGFQSDVKAHPTIGRQLEADSFVLENPTRLTRLEWWGSQDSDYFDAFLVRFFDDAEGLPGALRFEFTFTGVAGAADQGFRRYGVSLPQDVALEIPAGQTIWVSVAGADDYTADPTGDEVFVWCTGALVGYAREFALEGPWQAEATFAEPAFHLRGETLTPVESFSMSGVKSLFR